MLLVSRALSASNTQQQIAGCLCRSELHHAPLHVSIMRTRMPATVQVLRLQGTVPKENIRDTAVFPPLMAAAREGAKLRARALRHVAADELGVTIQEAEHSPLDDSRAALYVYQKHSEVWEAGLRAGVFKVRGLKTSGKIARGDFRQMAMRADATHTAGARPAGVATGGADGGAGEDEFAVPSAAAVARMKQRMATLTEDD